LNRADQQQRILSVNSSPIMAEDGRRRGAMATFDNLTILERKNARLRTLLQQLRRSRTEDRAQNKQHKILATRDPLTSCLNRRAGMAAKPMGGVNVTASLGVSAVSLGGRQPSEMLDQADKALYVAKRGGRNRVVGWHQIPPDQLFEKEKGRPAESGGPATSPV